MNLSAYFVEVSGILRKRLLPVIVFSGLFLVGILSGIVIDKPVAIEYYYLDYCDEYVYRIFSAPVWSIFPTRILNCILFLVPAVLISLCVFCIPLQGILVFYKGFVFGSVTVILFSVYKFSGFIIWLLVLLPQTLLFAAICIVFSVLAFDCGLENRGRKCCWGGVADCCRHLLFAACASGICALIEFLTVCLIFRPVSGIL